jgi:hypothetical protein
MSNKVYWTMKNGQKIDVDTMDINHLRNTLKMIINNQIRVKVSTPVKPKFVIHGEMASNFLEQMLEEDYYDPRDDFNEF